MRFLAFIFLALFFSNPVSAGSFNFLDSLTSLVQGITALVSSIFAQPLNFMPYPQQTVTQITQVTSCNCPSGYYCPPLCEVSYGTLGGCCFQNSCYDCRQIVPPICNGRCDTPDFLETCPWECPPPNPDLCKYLSCPICNGVCEGLLDCPLDCPAPTVPTCGDGVCEYNLEDQWNCGQDCCSYWWDEDVQDWRCSPCGDSWCDVAHGENLTRCPVDSCPTPPVCTGSDPTACGSSCVDCIQSKGVGAVCNGGVCSCPPGANPVPCVDEFGVKRCTNYAVDPSNCGGCAPPDPNPRGENCLRKTKAVAGQEVRAPEACWGAPGSPNAYGTCGVFQCNPDAGNPCGTLGSTDYKCCRNSDSSVFACTSVNSSASVVNCGACGNTCGSGGNAGRPFCCPSSGTYACSSAPCGPPI